MYYDSSEEEDDIAIVDDFVRNNAIEDEGVILQKMERVKKSGRSIVTRYIHPISNADIAVKAAIKDMKREALIQQGLSHPNIVRFIGYHTKWHRYETIDILFTEFCEHGTFESLKPIKDELEYKMYFSQVSKAMVYLKKMNIVHGDLKPENIFLVNATPGEQVRYTLKLGDFGFSEVEGTDVYQSKGTPYFMAPELIVKSLKDPYCETALRWTYKLDTWAFGCMCHLMITGKHVFHNPAKRSIYTFGRIICSVYPSLEDVGIDDPFSSSLIANILQVEPLLRLEPEEIDSLLDEEVLRLVDTRQPKLDEEVLKCIMERCDLATILNLRLVNRKYRELAWRYFIDKVDWWSVFNHCDVTENFIRCVYYSNPSIFENEVWKSICVNQKLSEEFIREFQDMIDLTYIDRRILSPSFIEEFRTRLDSNL